jgi:hypothetical protein
MDVDTLITSLLHFSDVLKLISAQNMPGQNLQIRIAAPERGSFIVHLAIFASQDPNTLFSLLPSDLLSGVIEIVTAFKGLLKLKAFLKGEQPRSVEEKEDGKIVIQSNNGSITINQRIFKIYAKNPEINEHIEKVFDTLSDNPEVEGLLIETKDDEPFHVIREEFPDLSRHNELLSEHEEIVKTREAEVFLLKLVFQRNRKWEFIYEGNKISAIIEDDDFWKNVERRSIQFTNGDALNVDLEITQTYDPDYNVYVNRAYKIKKVHNRRPQIQYKQSGLDDIS